MKVRQYHVVRGQITDSRIDLFEEEIEMRLNKGWLLRGELIVNGVDAYQAMVKGSTATKKEAKGA